MLKQPPHAVLIAAGVVFSDKKTDRTGEFKQRFGPEAEKSRLGPKKSSPLYFYYSGELSVQRDR